jgi:glycosyltransferase involved in cell wall biosynthesis
MTSRVCVGIHVYAEPGRLRSTLASLEANTSGAYELLLLLDGPDEPTRAQVAALGGLPQSGTAAPRGAAACINRLATASDADVVVLLESGALVGPGWLTHLLAALDADPRNGLAGPTTNFCWNEQGVYPHSGSTPDAVARTAQEAALRYGHEARTLEPLYSLSDFCYMVRREVIESIGGADEDYALGPCWEMDYNIRAARAGWRGVWAGASYVHRSGFTARRRAEEARRLETSKHLYQDRFCGARLRGSKRDYRSHCRGDACQNFAPAGMIQIRRPLQPLASDGAPVLAAAEPATVRSYPLVSCIMPTCNRRSFVTQSIRCFLRQDYSNLELLIIDDGSDAVGDCVPDDARIRYLRLDQKRTIGAKRNFGCEQARGDFIVHWDDDDWYPSWRVRSQLGALLDRPADVCGTSRVAFYDPAADRAWDYRYVAPGPSWVAGSTLAYRRTFWQQNNFPDVTIGEDTRFVLNNAGSAICDLLEPALCIAMVHSGNTSVKQTGTAFWHPKASTDIRAVLGDDRYFYQTPHASPQGKEWPLVSCIMPTYNRRPFVPLALQHFLAQDYPNKELVIVDDSDDPIGDLARDRPGVRYLRQNRRASIGTKRNLACLHARGDIIAHWDDDDWYSADRLRYQVAPIVAGDADITGLENAFVLALPQCEFWTTEPQLHERMFVGNVHGGTLVYTKDILRNGLRYPDTSLAEDACLLQGAVDSGRRLLRLSNPGVFVYVRHESNAWREMAPGRFLNPTGWKRIAPPASMPAGSLTSYRNVNLVPVV